MKKIIAIPFLAAVAFVSLSAIPVAALAITCPPGTDIVTLSLPNGDEKHMCLPYEAIDSLATAPGQATGVIDVSACPCDFSTAFIDKLDWDLPNTRCEDSAEEPREILFQLTDFVSGLGSNQLGVSGGTFIKGNRCVATVTIGGTRFPNLQDERDLTNGEVSACIKLLAAAADYLRVPNECD